MGKKSTERRVKVFEELGLNPHGTNGKTTKRPKKPEVKVYACHCERYTQGSLPEGFMRCRDCPVSP